MKQETNLELDKLELLLRGLKTPLLDSNQKFSIKARLFAKIDEPLAKDIYETANSVNLTPYSRASIKDKIFAIIEGTRPKRFFWSAFFSFQKKFVSALALIVMSFSLFSIFSVNVSVVRAETFTVLDDYAGEISLERDGQAIDVHKGMNLYENDKITTSEDGSAVIKFFDDSLSRLSSKTEIVIDKLSKPSDSPFKSHVEVSVLNGKLWSRVINLVEKKSSFTVKAFDTYTSTRKGAFNIEVADSKLEIGVFNNSVEVKSYEGTEMVSKGKKVFVDSVNKKVEVNDDLSDIDPEEATWVEENLNNDKQYLVEVEQKLLDEKIKSIGANNVDDVPLDKTSLTEQALLILTFDDIKRKKIELDLSEKDFIAAQIKLENLELSDEEKAKALDAINVFSQNVKEFDDVIKEVSYTDKDYAEELNNYVENKILAQKKNLSLTLPNSPSYKAKEVINELELLGPKDAPEIVGIKADQVSDKLLIAEEFASRGDYVAAEQAVNEYKDGVSEVIGMIDTVESDDSTVKKDLIDKVSIDLDVLTEMDTLADSDVYDLKTQITDLQNNIESSDNNEENVAQEAPINEQEPVQENIAIDNQNNSAASENKLPEDTYGVKVDGDKPLPPLLNF